jgi:phosphoserine phosphatase RsbU/P
VRVSVAQASEAALNTRLEFPWRLCAPVRVCCVPDPHGDACEAAAAMRDRVQLSGARPSARHVLTRSGQKRVMQIVIADDDPVARKLAECALGSLGAAVVTVDDGAAAWQLVRDRPGPMLLVLDREMPGLDGVELMHRARSTRNGPPLHILMVTGAGRPEDIADGLERGADDYVVKPFNQAELRARARVGLRMLGLQESLAGRVAELEVALEKVKHLKGLLPMCSYCKKIRVDDEYWQQVEGYISEHSEATFTHGICPECFPAALDQAKSDRR